ncbi:hypothetical protein P154DRAFT_110605 [Amniculicola lignicola CBS 123094]|uniref:Uncharacterized protein n=1 Tax=Amniculicola lignicola CBS 123094 TaxID=1392246 RepID=A0A6A5WQN9_9PLEO|nr:hypothetical protein P154DRAFT_110605 [Amniculicola lignicola CBS 123094]
MVDSHIIPVPAASGGGPEVLIEVKQDGAQPLDVRLVACDGEKVYVGKIKQRQIAKIKGKSYKGSDGEWHAILSHFLLRKQPEGDEARILDNLRMVYSLKDNDLELTIRRDVQGIKVTLGETALSEDDSDEAAINPFEWAQSAAEGHTFALKEVEGLKARLAGEKSIIAKLNAQLEDFIKTKNEAETAMLQQFMALLNEKKRKIRDQQRLLAGAKVDKSTASAVKATREATRPRKAGPSRASKRKATAKAKDVQPESESEEMELDQPKEEEAEEEAEEDEIPEAVTPDRSTDDETEDEAPSMSSAPQPRAKSAEIGTAKTAVAQSNEGIELPPRRELPFGRGKTRTVPPRKPAPPPPADDDDDETEDEEL